MNIRDWPMNRIMQLPDSCFGGRFCVSCKVNSPAGAAGWDISEIALPERFVLWELNVWSNITTTDIVSFRIALGDQLPTTTAMMDALEPLIQGLGLQGAEPRAIDPALYGRLQLTKLRMPYTAGGRRLVLEATGEALKVAKIDLAIVVSSIPTEVPDCLLSAHQ